MSILGRIKKAAQAFNEDSNDNLLPKDTRQLTPELRKAEEVLLAKVMKEVSKGGRREGVWAKALIDSDGDEKKAQSLYITYAAQSLIDDQVLNEKIENNKEVVKNATKYDCRMLLLEKGYRFGIKDDSGYYHIENNGQSIYKSKNLSDIYLAALEL